MLKPSSGNRPRFKTVPAADVLRNVSQHGEAPVLAASKSNRGRPNGHRAGCGLLLTDLSFRRIGVDQGALAVLGETVGASPGEPPFSIPPEIQTAIRELMETEMPALRTSLRIRNREYHCHAFVVKLDVGPLPRTILAFQFEGAHEETDSLGEFSTQYHLTSREEEALRGIAKGLTSKELADRMSIHPNTVKSFLRLIMIKVGVRRRGAILAKVLEHDRHRERSG
jgi:DNA-binding CsgD family transcriptional regulator